MKLRAAQQVAGWMHRESERSERKRFPPARRKSRRLAQRARLGGLEQRNGRRRGDRPLGKDGAYAARMRKEPKLRAPDRFQIELRPAQTQSVRGALDLQLRRGAIRRGCHPQPACNRPAGNRALQSRWPTRRRAAAVRAGRNPFRPPLRRARSAHRPRARAC